MEAGSGRCEVRRAFNLEGSVMRRVLWVVSVMVFSCVQFAFAEVGAVRLVMP